MVGGSRACHLVEVEGTVAGEDPEVEQKAPGFPPALVPLVADQSALPGGSAATRGRCPVSFALSSSPVSTNVSAASSAGEHTRGPSGCPAGTEGRDLALVMTSPLGDMASMLISCPALSRRHALGWGRNLGSKTNLVVQGESWKMPQVSAFVLLLQICPVPQLRRPLARSRWN